ncbi:unnamed protein product [Caenorhabditis angaria]|uniref:Annexin n=1 Tax=Caenorhabditis angaria TaxID=860376 RepID=A0A9P1I894_9PELO|nr:unnamed protein product [Caenorhabditis angaria]
MFPLFLFVIPSILGSEESDADSLKRAVLGLPFNESTLISVIYEKTYPERQKMVETFRNKYGEEIYKELWNKLYYAPRELTAGIKFNTTAFYDAKLLSFALTGIHFDEDVLIEIMVTRTTQEMREIKKAYRKLEKSDLCEDIESDVMGDLEGVLLALCAADKDEPNVIVDQNIAKQDIETLYYYGPDSHFRTDEDVYNQILFKRNDKQLRRMFAMFTDYQYYTKLLKIPIRKRTFEDLIEQEYSFATERALQRYIKTVKNRAGYFASMISDSLKDKYDGERRLIRIIFGRAGVDLPDIVGVFGGKKKLIREIRKTSFLSGFTKQALIAILKTNC